MLLHAGCLRRSGKPDVALDVIGGALKSLPNDSDVLFEHAKILMDSGGVYESIHVLEQVLPSIVEVT